MKEISVTRVLKEQSCTLKLKQKNIEHELKINRHFYAFTKLIFL